MRYICLDCGPDQKQFEVYGVHHLYVYTDENGDWVEDGDVVHVEYGDEYRCAKDPDHRVEYRYLNNIERLRQAVEKDK